jgi:hypothetical protein
MKNKFGGKFVPTPKVPGVPGQPTRKNKGRPMPGVPRQKPVQMKKPAQRRRIIP